MGCKHNYRKMKVGFNGDYDDMSMKELANQGNKSITGLMFKFPVVKRRGINKW